jgi:hypothetical protein
MIAYLVPILKKTIFVIAHISTKHVRMIYNYMFSNVRRIGVREYEISYSIRDQPYKLLVSDLDIPMPYIAIEDDRGRDISSRVYELMGPAFDFHGLTYDTDIFDTSFVRFEKYDGNEIVLHGTISKKKLVEQDSLIGKSKNDI